ncbi:Alpha/Beta hydrolase protein [Hypomontagnella monticulosa]|nr:Alpha/Beta hydrolase protein [Hypomontagnella monticulosa]
MIQTSLLSLLITGLAAVATARNCKDLTVPISISALNANLKLQAPGTQVDVTNFILNLAQPGMNYTEELISKNSSQFTTISGNYSIAATYCEPSSGPGSILQVLTHGIAFDRSYWDFPAQHHNYSYVNAALARGYSTFAFDRLGIGESSHGDPVREIQTALEIAALVELTSLLRAAKVPGISAKYGKVVHVGHSYGSVQTYALTAAHPSDLSDGIALTGFSLDIGDFVPYFLLGGNFVPARAASATLARYPAGYLASADITAAQVNFFAPGDFDPAILKAAFEAGEPVAVGELLTLGGGIAGNNTFGGPVLVITGERDIPFCGGNCGVSTPSLPAQANQSLTNAKPFEAVVVPGAGHGLNLEYSAQNTYTSILDFFDANVKS